MTEADKKKLGRMIPFQNLFWLRIMLDKLNEDK
jgi:hypothetical protein